MNLVIHSLVFGIIIPLVAGGFVLGISLVLRPKSLEHVSGAQANTDSRYLWVGGLALAVGYIAGYIGLLGVPKWSDMDAILWLIWLLPLAIALGIWDSIQRPSSYLLWLARAILLGLLFWLMFRRQVTNEVWTVQKLYGMLVLFTSLGLLFWFLWEAGTTNLSESQSAWLCLVFSTLLSVLFVLSGSAKFAQLFGVVVSVVGVWWVLAWWAQGRQRSVSWLRSVLPVLVFFVFGFSLAGRFYADVSDFTGSMILLSPLLLAIFPRLFTPAVAWRRIVYLTVLIVLPPLLALGVLGYKELKKPKDSPYYQS